MSITLTVSNPENMEQQLMTIPVATEAAFKTFWQRGSSELGLTWVPLFDVGIEVAKEDVSELIEELKKLDSWAKKSYPQQEITQMQNRLERLINEIPKIISQGKNIFIG